MRLLSTLKILLLAYICNAQLHVPKDFIAEPIGINLEHPVGIEFTLKGHAFIWDKDGQVWTFHDEKVGDQPLIDIKEEVLNQGDHGLIGLALHPSFLSNGYIYLYYVVDRHHLIYSGTTQYDPGETIQSQSTIGRITRYTLDEATNFTKVVPNSRKVILGNSFDDGLPILMTSHGVGSIVFGTDGSLMVSFGDGGSFRESDDGSAEDTYYLQSIEDGAITESQNVGSFRAMMPSTPHGKVLRINPENGQGYPSNPYFNGDLTSHQSRVWALGFRNPYKFMKVPNTGSHNIAEGDPGVFLLGDVGSSYWEELNVIDAPGKWYGWPIYEGLRGNWSFRELDPINLEAPNPAADCEYYNFRALESNLKKTDNYEFINPCDSMLFISPELTLIHNVPSLSYSSSQWNPPAKTEVLAWDKNGFATARSIQDDSLNVEADLLEGGSILPGAFNQFGAFPDEYQDLYFFGDYMGYVGTMRFNDDNGISFLKGFATGKDGLTDVKFNPVSGELFIVHFIEGKVYRVSYGGTKSPEIIANQNKKYGPSPLTLTIDASASVSYSGSLTYEWQLDGEVIGQESVLNLELVDNDPKAFNVELVVTDSIGKSSKASFLTTLNNTPPMAMITSIKEGDTYSIQEVNTILLEGEAIDNEHQQDDLTHIWQVDLYHDDHFHPGPKDYRSSTYAYIDPVGCGIEQYSYKVMYTVIDPLGLSATDTVDLQPYCGVEFASIVDLDAEQFEKSVELNWSDESDEVIYYIVEKSDDFLFRSIDKVDADGNSNYSYLDPSPFTGQNIYRIRAYKDENSYLYSNKAEVYIKGDDRYSFYPNPIFDKVKLEFYSENPIEFEAQVYSMTGQLVANQQVISEPNKAVIEIDMSNFPSGVYIIKSKGNGASYQHTAVKM